MIGRLGLWTGCGAIGVAVAAMATAWVPGIAEAQDANRVWAGCSLNSGESGIDTVQGLIEDMDASSNRLDPNNVAFVVIYSFQDNDGQPVNGGFTGPVICSNLEVTAAPATVLQTDDIGSGNVDILDLENAISLRYQLNDANVEKRFCHTVETNSDCYLFVPQSQ